MQRFFLIIILHVQLSALSQVTDLGKRDVIQAIIIDETTNTTLKNSNLSIVYFSNSSDTILLATDKQGKFNYNDIILKENDGFFVIFSSSGYFSKQIVFDLVGLGKNRGFKKEWGLPLEIKLKKLMTDGDPLINKIVISTACDRFNYNSSKDNLEHDFFQLMSYWNVNNLVDVFYKRRQIQDSLKLIQYKNEKALIKQRIEIEAKQTQQYFLYGGIILVLIFAGFIYNRFKIARKQKSIIEHQKELVDEKNKEIMDSMRYAKRIQQSLLPSKKYIERILNGKR